MEPKLITAFTRALYLTLYWSTSIQSKPSLPVSTELFYIDSAMPRSFKWTLTFRFPEPNLVCIYVFFFTCLFTSCFTQLILHDLFIQRIFGEEYKWCSPCTQFPADSCSFVPWAPSACSSLDVYNQVLHLCHTTGKTLVMYIIILIFLNTKEEDERFWLKW